MARFCCDGCDVVLPTTEQRHTRILSLINGEPRCWDFFTCELCHARLLAIATNPCNWMSMAITVTRPDL